HAAPAEREYAQPPPASAGAPATGAGAPPAPPAARTVAESSAAPARDDSALVAWARGQHERAVTLAQNGNCTEAAKVALGVSNRASSYYAQNMATDRALKQCASYINAERDRAAERSRKTRVQKNRTTVSE